MNLWSAAGSHAELSTQANYPKYVCCSGVSGLGNSCSGNYGIIARLSSPTNAHVETNASSDYPQTACLSMDSGSVEVGYQSGNCDGYQATVASISGLTNAHIGDSNAYDLKICASASLSVHGGGGTGSMPPYTTTYQTFTYGSTTVPAPPEDDVASINVRVALVRSLGHGIHGLVKLPDDGNPATQDDSTVYYIGADGRRHAFPNPSMYFSWYCDFSQVQTISANALAQIPLGKNIVYRPGIRLVKFLTDPKVYLVQASGLLRPLADEGTARAIAGQNWNRLVADISDAFYGDYTIGTPITLAEVSQASYLSTHEFPSAEMDILGYSDPGTAFTLICPVQAVTWPFNSIPKNFSFAHELSPTKGSVTDIEYLQEVLTSLGPSIYPEASVTGNYGAATTAAVKRFQLTHGLEQLGIVGPGTRSALNDILGSYR